MYIESRSVTGMTLAPTAPVARTADAMLATLASQVAQARTLRWISTDAIARNITDKLQAARGAIQRASRSRLSASCGGCALTSRHNPARRSRPRRLRWWT